MGIIERAINLDDMHNLTRDGCQKVGEFINFNSIHAPLHGADKVSLRFFIKISWFTQLEDTMLDTLKGLMSLGLSCLRKSKRQLPFMRRMKILFDKMS